jgi:hypothetical protein
MLLQESIGREALIALSNQYPSVAHALMEMVDNPFDYRRGRRLQINIDLKKDRDTIIVQDSGGEGMGEDGAEGLDSVGNWTRSRCHRHRTVSRRRQACCDVPR